MKINIEIDNITAAQSLAIQDMLKTMVQCGEEGTSNWCCFFADGENDFQPKIKINDNDVQFAPESIIPSEMRDVLWYNGEYRISTDFFSNKITI